MTEASGAEEIRRAATSGNKPIGRLIDTLDGYSIDIGKTHISLWDALVVAIVIVGIIVIAQLASRLSRYLLTRIARLDDAQKLLADKLATIGVWALAILVGIDFLGIDLTALAVFSGAFGLAIGFGLQKTFGNLIAGIILLMDRSIKPGDVIAVSDASGQESFGQIRKIGIRAISVTTRDMKEYLIPNENLMINQVENWSYSTRNVRIRVPVGVSYSADLDLVEKLLIEAAVGAPRVLVAPEPRAMLLAFGASSVDFEIHFWIADPEEGIAGVRSDVLKRAWHLFKKNGVELPFPQRDIHLKNIGELREAVCR